ncbi:UPF0122 protein YlxM [Marinithermofilum abyssi]|uniref:UPF0122 protein GCM10011571_17780 n=1 Tax=Marinithermofilum abyssi TaxID=1571185 RepID=A0A8J2VIJ2_9BACL|nr:putative DNA-binding protein [Marinithermofilum abyssi]GGE16541.1 UPF0122 protein YlxM [Marinithermofilum abyssi]
MLDKTTRVNLLYDFYAPLLTDKQRMMMELYYHEDWSLGEIAEHFGISRQAVFEAVKRAQTALEDLENRLHLVEKHRRRQEIAEQIAAKVDGTTVAKDVQTLLDGLMDLD